MKLIALVGCAFVAAIHGEELANLRGPKADVHEKKVFMSRQEKLEDQEKRLHQFISSKGAEPTHLREEASQNAGNLVHEASAGDAKHVLDWDYNGGLPGINFEDYVVTKRWTNEGCTGKGINHKYYVVSA